MKPDMGLERRRELNRLAAQKLRNRQKERAVNIRQEYFNAQSNNTRLVYERKQLHKERDALKSSLSAHLQFCQQQAASNLFLGNHIIYFAAPVGTMPQPILLTNMDQSSSGKIGLSISDTDLPNASAEVDNSLSGDEEYDEAVVPENTGLRAAEDRRLEENGDTLPLVIGEDGARNLQDRQSEKAVLNAPAELPVTEDKCVEVKSIPSEAVIPLMVLDME